MPASNLQRPESVLVVVYTPKQRCLLLERVRPPGFWQSITGTLRWDETPAEAAAREVVEETGLQPDGLIDAEVTRAFAILPEWRARYAADVKENLEHLWYLPVPRVCEVALNPEEHVGFAWLALDQAIAKVSSWTNREALQRLR